LRTPFGLGNVCGEVRSNGDLEATASALRKVSVQALALGVRERAFVELID